MTSRSTPIGIVVLPLLFLSFGCPPDRSPGDDDDSTAPAGPVCEGAPPLDDVCIEMASFATFSLTDAAAGIEVPYTVRVLADVDDVRALPQDAGGCAQVGPSGLMVFERLSGADQTYCECDVGLCPAPDPEPSLLLAGSWDGVFAWTGRNWFGPSDTGNPLGEPFPPGVYDITVSAIGTVDGEDYTVSSSLELTLTE